MSEALVARANRALLAAVPALHGRALPDDASLREELGIDSITMMSVAFRLEDEFGFALLEHAERLAAVRTLGELYAFLDSVGSGDCARSFDVSPESAPCDSQFGLSGTRPPTP